MSLYYAFEPAHSFIGRFYWQLDDQHISPAEWPTAVSRVKPIWVRFESGDGEDGYLRTESRAGSLEPWSERPARHAVAIHQLFWFGAYQDAGKRYYQLRPLQNDRDLRANPALLPWVLEADPVGYLGMYATWSDPPEWVKYTGGGLWQFEGLDPRALKVGGCFANLRMLDSAGNRVTRRFQAKRPYLSSGAVGGGRVTVEVRRYPWSP